MREALALGVLEADQERVDHGVDEEHTQDDERGANEDIRPNPLPVPLGEQVHDAVHRPVQEEDPSDADHDRHADDEEPVGVGVAQEVERRPQQGEGHDGDRERRQQTQDEGHQAPGPGGPGRQRRGLARPAGDTHRDDDAPCER